jgi:hypothetical protein
MGENIAIFASDRPNIEVRSVTRIADVGQAAWDALDHGPSPFLKYGFLRALELSGSIGSRSGWYPCYLLAEARPATGQGSPRLVGAVAAFVKSHSYGEYIFDWAWASASERAGIAYYPKLVIAAPHTPATGRRILLASDVDPDYVTMALAAGVKQLAEAAECSSIHWLFCTAEEQARLSRLGFLPRASFQFHWHNREYRTYEDFLDQLTSRKRKQLRKERRRAVEALDAPVEFLAAAELDEHHLEALDRYYRNTVWEHGGTDYLRPGFFHHLAELLPEHMYVAHARRGGALVAGALFLETGQGLFGRYWGCDQAIEFLHFETAYYAGIERCIERGIPLFEAGAQGEHKLLRGFLPSPTYSCHWLRHPGLAEGIGEFLDHERKVIRSRMAQLAACGPYRSECTPGML